MIPAHPAIIQIPSLHYEFPNSFPSMVSSCGAELAWGSWEVYEILLFASERCPCVSDKTEDESDYLCLLSINRNPVFFLHLQERHSGCCGTSPSWWNLLRPCCSVSCGQWLLLHKVVQCLIHAFSFVCRISPIYLKHLLERLLLFCLKPRVNGNVSLHIRGCSIIISEQWGGCWPSCWTEKFHAAIKPAGALLYEVFASWRISVPHVTWAMNMQPWMHCIPVLSF